MNKFFRWLLLLEACEIRTRLTKKEILKRIEALSRPEYGEYYGSASEDGFTVGEKPFKQFLGGHSQNSLAPVATARIGDGDGVRTVSVVIGMHPLVRLLFLPVYLISLLTVILFPLMLAVLHFAFRKPARALKEAIEAAVTMECDP